MGKKVGVSHLHDNDPDVFREALSHTEGIKGFSATLIEKDYYCSLVLRSLFDKDLPIIFKGGTCFSKVYTDFYRLSEDIDLALSVSTAASRSVRRAAIKPVKHAFEKVPALIPGVVIAGLFEGHNKSRQYIGYLRYDSVVLKRQETIKVEVGVREPVLLPVESRTARTMGVNPFNGQEIYPAFPLQTMAFKEACTEKMRAAISRKEPAIRDFFDLFYAKKKMNVDLLAPDFLDLVRKKLAVPGTDPVNLSEDRKVELHRQIKAQLRPMLRPSDYDQFRFEETFELVCRVAAALE